MDTQMGGGASAPLPSIQITREHHESPEWVNERLKTVGGTNLYGEANYRVVWGQSRMSLIGGRWTDTDDSGNTIREVVELRSVPKYFPHNRWYVERWMAPSTYGDPEMWKQLTTDEGILSLGPFPSRGEYEQCYMLQGKDEEFLPLSVAVVEEVVQMIHRGNQFTDRERWLATQRAYDKKEQKWDKRADDILDDTNTFEGKPHVYLPNEPVRGHRAMPRKTQPGGIA